MWVAKENKKKEPDEKMLIPLPATLETVAEYLADLAKEGYKYSTIARRVASISVMHQIARYDSPTRNPIVRGVLKGIARDSGTAKKQAVPLRLSEIRRVIYRLNDGLQAKRDRALLLLGWHLAARRSELVDLDVEDLEVTEDGMRVTIRHSKTDQTGRGETFGIPYCGKDESMCAVRAVRDWIDAAGIESGPLLRAVNRHGQVQTGRLLGRTVERVIQRYSPGCGGHSLRAGFITDQYSIGCPENLIAARSRHRSLAVMGAYRREANMFSRDYTDGLL